MDGHATIEFDNGRRRAVARRVGGGFGRAGTSVRRIAILALALAASAAAAQTQSQMHVAACAAYAKAQRTLDATYREVLARHEGDAVLIARIERAQKAWLAYRDAELAAIYPASDKQAEYGSAWPMCNCTERAALVKQRIAELSGWLSAAEGDVCAGSR